LGNSNLIQLYKSNLRNLFLEFADEMIAVYLESFLIGVRRCWNWLL